MDMFLHEHGAFQMRIIALEKINAALAEVNLRLIEENNQLKEGAIIAPTEERSVETVDATEKPKPATKKKKE